MSDEPSTPPTADPSAPPLVGGTIPNLNPDLFARDADRLGETFRRLYGSFSCRGQHGDDLIQVTYTFAREGEPLLVSAFFDRVQESIFIGLDHDVPGAVFDEIIEQFCALKPRSFVAVAYVSTGFRQLKAPLRVGNFWLAPQAHSHRHDVRDGPHQRTGGPVVDHILAAPIEAFSSDDLDNVAPEHFKRALGLSSFVLDHPIASYGFTSPVPSEDVEGVTLGEFLSCLQAHGCRTEAPATSDPPIDHPLAVAPDVPLDLPELIERLSGRDHGRIYEVLHSYRLALLNAEPEPGFDRSTSTSFAVMLWVTIVEELAPTAGHKTIAERVRAYVKHLDPQHPDPWPEFDEIRQVRHRLAHDAHISLQEMSESGHQMVDFKANKARTFMFRATWRSRQLARRAILDFVGRGGDPSPTEEEARKVKQTPIPKRHLEKLQEAHDLADKMRDAVKATDKGAPIPGEVRAHTHRVAALLQGLTDAFKAEEPEEEGGEG